MTGMLCVCVTVAQIYMPEQFGLCFEQTTSKGCNSSTICSHWREDSASMTQKNAVARWR